MGKSHFSGPVLFSNARPTLENLNIKAWPDQVVYMDDFTGVAFDNTNDWTVVKDFLLRQQLITMVVLFKVTKYLLYLLLLVKNFILKLVFLCPMLTKWIYLLVFVKILQLIQKTV